MNRRSPGGFRRSRGLGGGGSSPTLQQILGANMVELWDSRQGVTSSGGLVSSWIGRVAGSDLTAAGAARPTLGTDGAFFGGQPVIKSSAVGGNQLDALTTTLFAAGSSPYVAMWLRFPAMPGVFVKIAQFTDSPVTQNAPGLYRDVTDMTAWCSAGGPATITNTSTNPLFLEGYYAVANSAIAVDGGTPQLGARGALATNVTRVIVAEGYFALIVACAAVPTASQRAALQAYARSNFPP